MRRGMPRRRSGATPGGLLALAATLAVAACGQESAPEADLILTRARLAAAAAPAPAPGVATRAPASDSVADIAIAGGRILAIGDEAAVARHRGAKTRVLDLGGAVVAAGIEDALARPIEAGERLLNEAGGGTIFLDLSAAESEEDAVQRVRQRARAFGPGEWILGHGWDESRWVVAHPPDARLLSDIVAYNPVFLVRRGGGSAWVNRKALDAAGLEGAAVPVAGEQRDAILRRAPALSFEERRRAIETALGRAAASGVVAVAAVASTGRLGLENRTAAPGDVLDPWRDLARRGRLPTRVSLLVPAPSAAAEALLVSGPESFPGGGRLEIRTVLLDAHGIPGAAALQEWARRAASAGFDIAVVARRPDGIATALDLVAEARRARAGTGARVVLGGGDLDGGGDPGVPGLGATEIDMLSRAAVPVVIEAGPGEAGAAAILADALRGAGVIVAAGSGAGGPPPAALRPSTKGPWMPGLEIGGHADFVVLAGAAAPSAAGPGAAAPIEPAGTWIAGVEVFRRDAGARHPR